MSNHIDIDVFRKGKVSTGLTRDDVFDWPEEVGRLIEEHQPDLQGALPARRGVCAAVRPVQAEVLRAEAVAAAVPQAQAQALLKQTSQLSGGEISEVLSRSRAVAP